MRIGSKPPLTILRVAYAKTAYRLPGVSSVLERIRIARARQARRRDLDQLERYRRSGESLVHFLHIGKTGGTAVKEALAQHTTSGKHVLALHLHNYKLRDVPSGEKVVFFLRDPISRFVSGFLNQQRQGLPRYFSAWTKEEGHAFSRFSSPNELALALSSLDLEQRTAAEAAMRAIKHVRSSVWDWFADPAYFTSRASDILFIGFQERLDDDFEHLKSILGLPGSIRLPGKETESHRTPGVANKHLDDDAKSNLHRWYAADYAFLDLCSSIMALELPRSLTQSQRYQ